MRFKYQVILEESSFGEIKTVYIPVERLFGRYRRVSVQWKIVPFNNEENLKPMSGNVVFEEGQGEANITIQIKNDEV